MMSNEELLKLTKAQIIQHFYAEIDKAQKAIESERATKEMYQRNARAAEGEIQSLHSFLDGLPNVMPKKKSDSCWEDTAVSTRLLSWIASRLN